MRWAANPLFSSFELKGWLPAGFSDAGSRLIVRNRTSRRGTGRFTSAIDLRLLSIATAVSLPAALLFFPGDRIRSAWTSLLA